jgi:hypothetical protein
MAGFAVMAVLKVLLALALVAVLHRLGLLALVAIQSRMRHQQIVLVKIQ